MWVLCMLPYKYKRTTWELVLSFHLGIWSSDSCLSSTTLAHVHHFYHHTSVIITTEQTSMQRLKVMKQLAGILELPIKLLYFGSWLLYYSQLSFLGPQEKKKHMCICVHMHVHTYLYIQNTYVSIYTHKHIWAHTQQKCIFTMNVHMHTNNIDTLVEWIHTHNKAYTNIHLCEHVYLLV